MLLYFLCLIRSVGSTSPKTSAYIVCEFQLSGTGRVYESGNIFGNLPSKPNAHFESKTT